MTVSRAAAAGLRILAACLAVLTFTATASAADHVVEVRDDRFVPAVLEIAPGDTVVWRTVGRHSHNVRADDDSFRCARGCDGDGQGGDGTPTTPWELTLAFPTPGEVPYHCELHGFPAGSGMAGRIVVDGGQALPGVLAFAAERFTGSEAAGALEVEVVRLAGADGAVAVDVVAGTNGTATAGIDYSPGVRRVAWADGDTAPKRVSFDLIDDSRREGLENFQIFLENPSGGASVGPPLFTLGLILDDESGAGPPVFSFERTVASTLESSAVFIDVVRTGDLEAGGTISVRVTSEDGSAVGGEDYFFVADTLNFSPRVERQQIIVFPIDDDTPEPPESFRLVLEPPDEALLGFPSAIDVFIFDDDQPGVGALTAEQVSCDAVRLRGFLARASADVPRSPRQTGINLTLTGSGDFAGVAYIDDERFPLTLLTFSSNPEETTLLRNPFRPPLTTISLTRNQTSSDLVPAGSPDELRVSLDPTGLAPGGAGPPDPLAILTIDNVGDPLLRTGGTPGESKPGRGLGALVVPCHGNLGKFDVHVLTVLQRLVRGGSVGAAEVETAIYRGAAPRSYRIDLMPYSADGSLLGILAAELVLDPGGEILRRGTLRVLAACAEGESLGCTQVSDRTVLELRAPVAPGEPSDGPVVRVVATPAGERPDLETAPVDFTELLAGTLWRPPLK